MFNAELMRSLALSNSKNEDDLYKFLVERIKKAAKNGKLELKLSFPICGTNTVIGENVSNITKTLKT